MSECDAVFQGGGVKGIGFAGAIQQFERRGYRFMHVAGTSAGAIAAALLAAGYNGSEISSILTGLDYELFKQKNALAFFGRVGSMLGLATGYGIYRADYFEQWLQKLLADRGVHTFADVRTGSRQREYRYRFQAVAADLSSGSMLALPHDLQDFGLDPDEFPIARAVRMSMSIPVFFQPARLLDSMGRQHIIVDGGLLSNYPMWLLDDGKSPARPAFGFRLLGEGGADDMGYRRIHSFVDYIQSLFKTMMEACDNHHISRSTGDFQRTILISTTIETEKGAKAIKTTDFDITPQECLLLQQNGSKAATDFLLDWDFIKWKAMYRKGDSLKWVVI